MGDGCLGDAKWVTVSVCVCVCVFGADLPPLRASQAATSARPRHDNSDRSRPNAGGYLPKI